MVPGNLGGLTWSGYAFDPQRSVLVTNSNNLVAVAKLIPRVKFDAPGSHSEDGDYGDQTGAPYGLYRRFLQSPSDLPCGRPPWGTLTALDMTQGKIRWQIPLGSMQDFGGAHSQHIPAARSVWAVQSLPAAESCLLVVPPIRSFAHLTWKPARNCGKLSFRPAPMPRP